MKTEERIYIGKIIRNARVFNFKNWPGNRMNKELKAHLSETDLQALEEIISEIQQRIERFRRGIGNNE